MIINQIICAVGKPTKEQPRPYEDAIKKIEEDLLLYTPLIKEVFKITVTVEIE